MVFVADSTSSAASKAPIVASKPLLAFFWGTRNDSNTALQQCHSLEIQTAPNSGMTPVAPFYFTAAPVGFQVSRTG